MKRVTNLESNYAEATMFIASKCAFSRLRELSTLIFALCALLFHLFLLSLFHIMRSCVAHGVLTAVVSTI